MLERHFGIDRGDEELADGRRPLLSADFYIAYQSLARLRASIPSGAGLISAGISSAPVMPTCSCGTGVMSRIARIADLYLAHAAMAAAEPATEEHATAQAGFEQALAAIDTARTQTRGPGLHPAAKKVLATLDREWDGLARHRDFPDLDLDNNKSERALRTPVVGRKNYYGSHANRRRAPGRQGLDHHRHRRTPPP